MHPLLKIAYLFFSILFVSSPLVLAQVQSNEEREAKTAYIEGLEAFVNEEYDRATTLLLEAYQALKPQSGISFALADVYFLQEDLPNAALFGKEAVELEPTNKWYRFRLAEIYRSAGQNQATLEQLAELLEYYPDDYDALFMLADTQSDYGEHLSSNNTLNRVLRAYRP